MGSTIKRVVKFAAPIAGSFFGPAGTAAAAAISSGLTGSKPKGEGSFAGDALSIATGLLGANRARRNTRDLQNLALPPEVQALRGELAQGARGVVPDLLTPVEGGNFAPSQEVDASLREANELLLNTQNNQALVLIDQARKLNLVSDDQIRRILTTSEQAGASIEQAAMQILGENGVVSVISSLNEQVPDIVADAQARIDQVINERPELRALEAIESQLVESQGLDTTDAIRDIRTAQPVDAANQAILQGLTGQLPEGFQGFEDFSQSLLADAQSLNADIQASAGDLKQSILFRANEKKEQSIEQLKDQLAASGIGTDSGIFIEAAERIRQNIDRETDANLAQVDLEVEQRTIDNEANAIQLASSINRDSLQNRLAAIGQQTNIAGGVQDRTAGLAVQEGQLSLAESQQVSDLATRLGQLGLQGQEQAAALQQLIPQLAFLGIQNSAQLTDQQLRSIVSGIDTTRSNAEFTINAANQAGDVQRSLIEGTGNLDLARLSLPAQGAETILNRNLQNESRLREIDQQNFTNDLTNRQLQQSNVQLALSGANSGIAALPQIQETGSRERAGATSAITEGLQGLIKRPNIQRFFNG